MRGCDKPLMPGRVDARLADIAQDPVGQPGEVGPGAGCPGPAGCEGVQRTSSTCPPGRVDQVGSDPL